MNAFRCPALATSLFILTLCGPGCLDDNPAAPPLDEEQLWPFMSSAVVSGSKLYVACQRLRIQESEWGATYVPYDTSCIVIIDTELDSVLGSIPLAKKNPASISCFGEKLYVSSTGSWSDAADGGIECIDLVSGENAGVVVDESELGGNITTVVMVSEQKGYVCVGKNSEDWSSFWTEVVEFDVQAKTVIGTLENIEDAFGGMAFDGRYLYVGDRSLTNPGIVVIDPVDNSLVSGPISVGMSPSSIAILHIDNQEDSLRYAVVTTVPADYSSANVALVDLQEFTAASGLLPIHSDNVVRTFGESIYILERLGADNLIRIDGTDISAEGLSYQTSLGSSVETQDIACAGALKGYVTQWKSNDLLVIELATGAVTGRIDLSAFATTPDD